MPVFVYQGYKSNGKSVNGFIDAENIRSAKQKLKADAIFPTSLIEEAKEKEKKKLPTFKVEYSLRRIKSQDISLMTRQLATLFAAGLPLVNSLSALVEQVEDVRLKKVLTRIRDNVNEGASLADALSEHKRIFPDVYISMVKSGEASGALDVVLSRLAEFMEASVELKNKVSKSLYYPVFMIGVGSVFMFLIMTVLIPRITRIFEDVEMVLPIFTVLLISFSNILRDFWWVFIILFGLAAFGLRKFKNTKRGREIYDRTILSMPIIGKIARMLAISRFARTLSTLLASGVPLLKSMDIVGPVVGNTIISNSLKEARDSISEGASIADPLKRSGHFPPILIHMIAVGEKSGELEQMLTRVAVAYDNEVEMKVSGLVSLLEPIMILFMAVAVVFLLLAILFPILQLSQISM